MNANVKIIEVWFPDDGNSHNSCVRLGEKGVTKISHVVEYYHGQERNYIFVEQDKIRRRIFPEHVTEIVYSQV